MCAGETQPLQELKKLATIVHSSQIPQEWLKYVVPSNTSTSLFISDFKKRIEQFTFFIENANWQKKGVWLGGIIFPEAFMTATR